MKRLLGRFQEWRPEAVGEKLGHYYKSSLQYAAMSARSRLFCSLDKVRGHSHGV